MSGIPVSRSVYPLFLVLCTIVSPRPGNAGDWPYAQYDKGATARSEAQGLISSQPRLLPTQSSILTVDELALGDVILLDIDGDTVSDVITTSQGRITAFRSDGTILWSTPLMRATQLLGIHDLDGDGAEAELVAVAKGLAGGIYVVHPYTGGLLWQHGPLTERSGVQQAEVAIFDIDGDGGEELFFAENSYGNTKYYAADFSNGIIAGEVAQTTLPAPYANYTPSIAGNMLDAGPTIITQQDVDLGVMVACNPGKVGASCSPQDAICLCQVGVFEDVYPGFSYGPTWAADVDDDGLDEMIEIRNSARYGSQIAVLDPNDAIHMGSMNEDDLFLWTYDYGYDDPETTILLPAEELEDLDGDGDLDLLVVFHNNLSLEVDQDGDPANDGINHAGAFVSAVFDAGSGDLVLAMHNTLAWGTGDFDGDGVTEIVTSTTVGWSYLTGIEGLTLDCDPDCSTELAWFDRDHTLIPDLDLLDGASFPELDLGIMDAGGDGDLELLAWDGDALELLRVTGGGVTQVAATLTLGEGEGVRAVDGDGAYALLASETDTRLVDTELWVMATSVVGHGQAVAEVLAVQFDPTDPRAYLVVNGAVYRGDENPETTDDAVLLARPHVLFAEDLTGDGYAELVTWAQPDESEDGHLVVDTYTYDPSGPNREGSPFRLLWSFHGSSETLVAGYRLRNTTGHHARPADLDGDGDPDVVFALFADADHASAVLALDGQNGALLDFYDASFIDADEQFGADIPIWVTDQYGSDGTDVPDGRDDLVFSDGYGLYLVPGGATQPAATYETDRVNWEAAFTDLDGDGGVEAVMLKSTSVAPTVTAATVESCLPGFWGGDAELAGLENSSSESMAVIVKDAGPGMDIAYASASGSVEVREGESGALAAGYPVYLWEGAELAAEDMDSTSLNAAAVFDGDGDGYDELIVGGDDGWVYALNVHEKDGGPSLEWTYYIGIPVHALRVADVDGDTHDEVIVVCQDSRVRILDGLGVSMASAALIDGDPRYATEISILGKSDGVDHVDLYVAGVMVGTEVTQGGDAWDTLHASVPGDGLWEVRVVGADADGEELVYDTIIVNVGGVGAPIPDNGCACSQGASSGARTGWALLMAAVLFLYRRSRRSC